MREHQAAGNEQATEAASQSIESPATGGTQFSQKGTLPPVGAPTSGASAGPTGSEQAFETKEQHAERRAEHWNEQHRNMVEMFNLLTGNEFITDNKIDVKRVMEFQRGAHITPDGSIGPQCLRVARANATPEVQANADALAERQKNAAAAPAVAPDKFVQRSEAWNARHPGMVAEFNKLTNNACVVDGKLDAYKFRDFQKEHGTTPDGQIGPLSMRCAQAFAAKAADKVAAKPAEPAAAPVVEHA